MLLGGPLFLAQLESSDISEAVHSGDRTALQTIKMGTVITGGQLIKALSNVPLVDVLRFINRTKANSVSSSLTKLQHDLN